MPTSSGCCKNYISHLENVLEMKNAGILPEEVISHAFGWLFYFQSQALNAQVSENQLSFQKPEK